MILSMPAAGPASADTDCATTTEWLTLHPSAQAGDPIVNNGDLTLHDCTISGRTTAGQGGGIYNDGTLTLTNVVIEGNHADGVGGGIYNSDTIYMTNVTVRSNTACSPSPANPSPCTDYGDGGGGIANIVGSVIGTRLTVADNTAITGDGGGILNDWGGTFCLSVGDFVLDCKIDPRSGNSLVTGNHASAGSGGGIANLVGTVTLSDSTVDGNYAERLAQPDPDDPVPAGVGGGVWNVDSTNLINVTISNNTATGSGGGIFNEVGTVGATNVTIAQNKAGVQNPPGGDGGGVYTSGFAILTSCTIADNTATGDGGGVYDDDGSTMLLNTLLARNGTNCAGTIMSLGNNLDTGTSCAFGSGDQSAPDVDDDNVGLRTLNENGGPDQGSSERKAPMMTLALDPTSPAVDTGVDTGAGCPTRDERGITRPQLAKACGTSSAICDIGAYELAPCLTVDKTCALVTPPAFTCKAPFTALKMQWAPGSMTDASKWVLTQPGQVIDINAWKGKVGEKGASVVSTQCDIQPGQVVTVTGVDGKPDSEWQIYAHSGSCVPGDKSSVDKGSDIGRSSFKIDKCDDPEMNSAASCGNFEGDNKGKTGYINDWILEGLTGSSATDGTLDCSAMGTAGLGADNCVVPVDGGTVVYTYKVKNIGCSPVNGVVLVDNVDGKPVFGPTSPITLDPGEELVDVGGQPLTLTATITKNTTNVATVMGTNAAGQCLASDKVTVNVACVLGYPYTSGNPRTSIVFSEPEVLRAFEPDFAGPGDTIRLFYNDEHALTLGVRRLVVKTKAGTTTTDFPITPLTTNPDSAVSPEVGTTELTGDAGGADVVGAPMFPALFITDVTIAGLDNKDGDWQFGGTPIPPHFVAGSWKGAVKTVDKTKSPSSITVTPDADPAKNNWTLGSGSDPVPSGLKNEGYGAEVRWDISSLRVNLDTGTGSLDPADPVLSDPVFAGHTFRLQFMVHDGDQNKTGGDVGQNCSIVTIPEPQ